MPEIIPRELLEAKRTSRCDKHVTSHGYKGVSGSEPSINTRRMRHLWDPSSTFVHQVGTTMGAKQNHYSNNISQNDRNNNNQSHSHNYNYNYNQSSSSMCCASQKRKFRNIMKFDRHLPSLAHIVIIIIILLLSSSGPPNVIQIADGSRRFLTGLIIGTLLG